MTRPADPHPTLLSILSGLTLPFPVGAAVRDRLVVGAREYGDRSLSRPVPELLAEVAEEPVDAIGWSVLTIHALRGHADDDVLSIGGPSAGLLREEIMALAVDLGPLAARAQRLAASVVA